MTEIKIKICGLFRDCDARYVNDAVPDYAGFVFFKKSHRFVADTMAKALRNSLYTDILTVGVFVNDDLQHIKHLYENGTINIIQLHGDENESYINALRHLLPEAEIWKAFRIRSVNDIQIALCCTADNILLDNGCGSGECFDWSVLQQIDKPYILAGGLNISNIKSAVNQFHPYAVDISSGVETKKIKDREKILAAVAAVKGKS